MARCVDCGGFAWAYSHHRRCRTHELAERRRREQAHRDWHAKTGHCGLCGQPGDWCQCTERTPCGCRDLHPMGSGIGVDPAERYTTVCDNQGELFG